MKGETALTFAAAYGRIDVVKVLTAHKADVSVTTKVQDLAAFAKEEQERLADCSPSRVAAARAALPPRADAAAVRRGRKSPASPGSTTTPSWSATGAACRRCISPRARATAMSPPRCSTPAPT